jgi:chromosome segregation protein
MKTKINKISLQGFKSFRKRVSIPMFPGFNVFCGPNGVGKSNILDAISFVIGGTFTKALRDVKLRDLVYHGNGEIPASEYAAVTLWLDNEKKIFPYETPEVAIKRKINKKGLSVFKINGKTTTREKIQELLSSARIQPDGYNIMMQGDVTQIVEMTPQERRGIIDEISGIAKYNEKKDKANKNLDSVEEKLKEVEIILTERLERLQELEKDRNTALKYKELTDKLRILEASLAYKRFQTEQEKVTNIEEDIENCETEIEKLEETIKQLDQDIETKEERKEKITEIIFVRTRETGIREEIEDVKNKIFRDESKIEANEREIQRLNNTIDRLKAIKEKRPGSMKRSVKTILDLKRQGIYGTVSDLIKIPSEYSTAIEVAGGYRLQNLVVDNTKTASECINFLKRERIGRATFLPINKIKPRKLSSSQKSLLKKPGVIGLASNLLDFDRKYSSAIDHIFGSTIIVENLGVARKLGIGSVRMVTLDGDLVETSGAMIGGFYKKKGEVEGGIKLDTKKYEQQIKDLEEEMNFLRIELDQLNKKLGELEKNKEAEGQEVLDIEKEKAEIEHDLVEMKANKRRMLDERVELQSKFNRLKINSARREAELNNLKLEVDKYKKIEYIDEKPNVLEFQIQEVTTTLNALGLVNMKAIEAYDEFKGEFDELKMKYDKIRKEKQAILDMIEKIESKRKEAFYVCLKEIDKNFREVFKQIANGKGSIELEDPLDIESGLLIQANPSGKNLLNMDSMSGGEKALTALAFLFSVQKYKPAPFYVMDEIDASLDKVNTKRIVDMIKKLSQKEQFVIITHNDYTIKKGDRVYGVSMDGGESKILGLELPKEAN